MQHYSERRIAMRLYTLDFNNLWNQRKPLRFFFSILACDQNRESLVAQLRLCTVNYQVSALKQIWRLQPPRNFSHQSSAGRLRSGSTKPFWASCSVATRSWPCCGFHLFSVEIIPFRLLEWSILVCKMVRKLVRCVISQVLGVNHLLGVCRNIWMTMQYARDLQPTKPN